jgi:hypothetical protein
MKTILIALLVILSVASGNAKEKDANSKKTDNSVVSVLSGAIVDVNSGESLVGVEVKLKGTDLKTYTDFDGKFSFKNVKRGEYMLVSSYISYNESCKRIMVSPKSREIKIKLQTSK